MTPEQLAVERDALLAGGRTLEEVERMQALVNSADLARVVRWFAPLAKDGVLGPESIEKSVVRLARLLSAGENAGGASAPRPEHET